MEEEKRSPILGHVAGIPVANPYFSGKLKGMTTEQLQGRLQELLAADPDDEDSDEAFMARGEEIDAIKSELGRRPRG